MPDETVIAHVRPCLHSSAQLCDCCDESTRSSSIDTHQLFREVFEGQRNEWRGRRAVILAHVQTKRGRELL